MGGMDSDQFAYGSCISGSYSGCSILNYDYQMFRTAIIEYTLCASYVSMHGEVRCHHEMVNKKLIGEPAVIWVLPK